MSSILAWVIGPSETIAPDSDDGAPENPVQPHNANDAHEAMNTRPNEKGVAV